MKNFDKLCYDCKFAGVSTPNYKGVTGCAETTICLITETTVKSTDTCEEWVDYNA